MMISDVEAAHILIAMSRSKPRVVVKATTEKENRLHDRVPRQKRSSSRRKMRRSFPMDPSSSTALVAYVSQEDDPNGHSHHSPSMASPRTPRLSRKKRPRASSSTAIVEYVSQEDESPPTTPCLSRKKRPPPFPHEAKQPKKKKVKTVAASSWTSEPAPNWLLKLMKGGEEPKKIIEKELSATDVNHNHNRLSMPCSNIIDLEFLSLAEQGIIEEDEGKKHKSGINAKLVVKFVDSDALKEFDVNFRRWKMPKKQGSPTFIYNLVTGWNKTVNDCGLDENDKIRVWSFHSEGKLCFALVLATPAPPGHPLLLLPSPLSDSENSEREEMSSALVIFDKSNDDLLPK